MCASPLMTWLDHEIYNWETATFGKIWDNEDVHDLRSVETEFPAIVFNDTLTSEATSSCEPTVSSLNNDEINFRISFDESDDEDCTVIFDKNSFSYKIISVNNLKTDSENDNDKVNTPLLPSPEPTVSYFDYFKDFDKEFPAIVYNDAQTSKLDFLTEPILSPQHIDEFNLKDETSLSECDEEEQNILNFNDLFPFNVIYPNDLKSDEDNDDDDDKIDIKQSSGDMSVIPLSNVINADVAAYAHGSNKLLKTIVKAHVILLSSQLMVNPKNEELPKELSGIIMIVKMVKLHRDLKYKKRRKREKLQQKREEKFEDNRFATTEGITRRIDYSLIRLRNQRCRVLYKVEDIAAYLVKYVKFWDDWEVDRYGNANLG
ncbi:hypothetical protein Tco_0637351 [Tanacetum coccineum]